MECESPGCNRESRSKFKDGPQVCGLHYQRLLKYDSFNLPEPKHKTWATCTVEGCDNKARTRNGRRCEKHYCRARRTGSVDDPFFGKRTITDAGYVVLTARSHPIAPKCGVLYEHRMVLYDTIGGGTHPCHWCKQDVSWDIRKGPNKLVADHLDNNKENNDISNLVPACHSCNTSRGLFANWAMKHKDDPFLLMLFKVANDNAKPVCEAV